MRAAVAALFLLAFAVRAQVPVYPAPDPPPDVYSALTWRHGGVDAPGWWFTDAQVQRINLRLNYLEDRATKDCITSTNAETRKILGATPTLWIAAGTALMVGVLGGLYLGHRL